MPCYVLTWISVAPKVPLHSSFDTGWVKPFDEFFYTISPTNAFVWQFFSDVLQTDRMSHLIIFVLILSCVRASSTLNTRDEYWSIWVHKKCFLLDKLWITLFSLSLSRESFLPLFKTQYLIIHSVADESSRMKQSVELMNIF